MIKMAPKSEGERLREIAKLYCVCWDDFQYEESYFADELQYTFTYCIW